MEVLLALLAPGALVAWWWWVIAHTTRVDDRVVRETAEATVDARLAQAHADALARTLGDGR